MNNTVNIKKVVFTKKDKYLIIHSPFMYAWYDSKLMKKYTTIVDAAILEKFGLSDFKNREVQGGESPWCEGNHIFYKQIDSCPDGVTVFDGNIQHYLQTGYDVETLFK